MRIPSILESSEPHRSHIIDMVCAVLSIGRRGLDIDLVRRPITLIGFLEVVKLCRLTSSVCSTIGCESPIGTVQELLLICTALHH